MHAQTKVQGTYTLEHWRADRGTWAHKHARAPTQSASTPRFPPCPSSQFPPRRGPVPAPLPLAERPHLAPVARGRAPRAHPPGGPGVGARSRAWPSGPPPRAGRAKGAEAGWTPPRAAIPSRYASWAPCVWESQKFSSTRGPEMKRSPIPSPLGRQESDAANKSPNRMSTTAPAPLHLTRISAPPPPDPQLRRKKVSQPNPGKSGEETPPRTGWGAFNPPSPSTPLALPLDYPRPLTSTALLGFQTSPENADPGT